MHKIGWGGTWTDCRFKWELGKKERGGAFEGRGNETPMHTMYIPNKTNIKLSKRNLSGKNKLICIIYMGAKTDEVIFTKDKCFNKGCKEPHSCLPFSSISILQHLIALSDYLPLSLKQPFCFAFAFQTGLFFTVSTQALTKTLPRMFTHFFSTSDFKVFFKFSFPILLVILPQ